MNELEHTKAAPRRFRLRSGQIIRTLMLEDLPKRARRLVEAQRLNWITRNSCCPCGSGKRFKRCCLLAP